MRCLLCASWSVPHICNHCRREQLKPSFFTRMIAGKIAVHSFYRYNEIEPLLLSKHTDLGHPIYATMAKIALRPYAKTLDFTEPVAVVGIDDHVRYGYSHTALLARAMKSRQIVPRFGKLRDCSGHRYSGQDFQFRLTHPRAFEFRPFTEKRVILVDDILTTGLTLTQAAETLQMAGKEVLFCLTLADADNR